MDMVMHLDTTVALIGLGLSGLIMVLSFPAAVAATQRAAVRIDPGRGRESRRGRR